jgi:hypothetical protein
MYTNGCLQSEEARLEFDKEPGHDKLKVSWMPIIVVSDC